MPRERIAKVNPDDIGRPHGTYRVELTDRHTGKVRERVDVENYITPLLLDRMKWEQARAFHDGLRLAHLGGATTAYPDDVSPVHNLLAAPTIANEFIAGLSSSLAEDTSSRWGTGLPVGYASRWKLGIPASGPRGQINEAQSEITLDSAKVVFDFNENQGNGEINSLAICRLVRQSHGTGSAALSCRQGHAGFRGGMPVTELDASWRYVCGYSADMTTMYAIQSTGFRISEFDMATNASAVDSLGVIDTSAITTATDRTYQSPTLADVAWHSSSSSGITRWYFTSAPSVVRDANTYYISYTDRQGNLYVGAWNRTTGARLWYTTVANSGFSSSNTSQSSLVLVAGKLYVVASTSSSLRLTGRDACYAVFRVNPGTGAVEATIPLGNDPAGDEILAEGGLTTDGTDLYVNTTMGIVKMTTAGLHLDYYGSPHGLDWFETGLAPWDSGINDQRRSYMTANRDMHYVFNTESANTGFDHWHGEGPNAFGGFARIHCDDTGKLWSYARNNANTNTDLVLYALDGGNIFSRAVLDTTVNKTTSSTMKWTYEITFPSEWRLPSAHPVPPS